jgi:hypothetical protein
MAYDVKIKNFQGLDPNFYAQRRLCNRSTRLVDAVKNLDGTWLEMHHYQLSVMGDHKPHKDLLKSLKFKWDYRNKRWYKSVTFTTR